MGFKSGFGDGFTRFYRSLLHSIFERHDTLAAIADRLIPPRATFRIIFAVVEVACVVKGDWLGVSFWPLYFVVLPRVLGSFFRPHGWLLALWEFFLWAHVVTVGLAILGLLFGAGPSDDVMVRSIISMVEMVGITYLVVDLVQPPRKRRKREPAPAKAKAKYDYLTV